jgi:hypothetical protein
VIGSLSTIRILNSEEYKKGGALLIIWDDGEDSAPYSDGPIGMFLLSPLSCCFLPTAILGQFYWIRVRATPGNTKFAVFV